MWGKGVCYEWLFDMPADREITSTGGFEEDTMSLLSDSGKYRGNVRRLGVYFTLLIHFIYIS